MKERLESDELKVYKSLDSRKKLNAKEKQYFAGLEKGFNGEKLFDQWLEPVLEDRILLPDMQFMPNSTFVQIDTILLTSKLIYSFEVKNYEGDHMLEGDELLRTDGTDTKNPILQLKRNEPVLRKILDNLGCKIPIRSIAVFVNPSFYLYNAPVDLPIIYPTQLKRFIEKLNYTPSFLKKTHTELAKNLISSTVAENPYVQLPDYRYDELRKGIVCPDCGRFYGEYVRSTLTCSSCGGRENAYSAVLRTIEEFKLLFPDDKITISRAMDWCSIVKSPDTMQRILVSNLKLIKTGRGSHYVNEN
ncbi:nuclease-related domain-containing protein [Bacillus sp. SCS-153A]|uniref:nuclease-related domain-containing protein n=1 Tax=Rossellomorea sedimentorum TaxID=3115294 RepID=UPI003906BA46